MPQVRLPGQDSHMFAPEAVRKQNLVIATKGIGDLEMDILALLQRLVFDSKGPGQRTMLPLWTCLWLLILIYRRTREILRIWKGFQRLALATQLCDMLITIYSRLFRPSSSLCLDWLKPHIYELYGKDWRVTEAVGSLKTDMKYIYESLKISW